MKRPLVLHPSALSPDEFGPLTSWLHELLPPPQTPGPAALGSAESLAAEIRVDDVGRFLLERLRVDAEVWEDILALFHPSHTTLQPRFATSQSHLRALTPLTTGQVLCVLRLVVHASAGRSTRSEGVDLTFRQATVSPDLTQAPSQTLFATYLAKKHAKPPPPPVHVNRRSSAQQKGALSAGVEITPPGSPPPQRRASLRAPPPRPPPPPSRTSMPTAQDFAAVPSSGHRSGPPDQSPALPDSELLHATADDGISSSSSSSNNDDDDGLSSSSTSNDGRESVGRRRWVSTINGNDKRAQRTNLDTSPPVDRLTPPLPTTTAMASGPSSNPFRARLQSVPSTTASPLGPDVFRTLSAAAGGRSTSRTPSSPALPPRPACVQVPSTAAPRLAKAPPLPPRSDQSYTQSSSSSVSGPTRSQDIPSLTTRPADPSGSPTANLSNAFKTTELVHRSLAAAEEARREAVRAPDRTRRIEVIRSSSPTRERGLARPARAGHGEGREGSLGGGSSAGSKWKSTSPSLSLGHGRPSPAVGGGSPVEALSGQSTSVAANRAPPLPPPPVRRTSSLSKPITGGTSSSSVGNRTSNLVILGRHASLSSPLLPRDPSLSPPQSSSYTSVGGRRESAGLRTTLDRSVRAVEHELARHSRQGLPKLAHSATAALGGWAAAAAAADDDPLGERKHLMDANAIEAAAEAEHDSADDSHEALRRGVDREEEYRPLA